MIKHFELNGHGGEHGTGYFHVGSVQLAVPLPSTDAFTSLSEQLEREIGQIYTDGFEDCRAAVLRHLGVTP